VRREVKHRQEAIEALRQAQGKLGGLPKLAELKDIKGAWIEDKKFTISLHFRTVHREKFHWLKRYFIRQ